MSAGLRGRRYEVNSLLYVSSIDSTNILGGLGKGEKPSAWEKVKGQGEKECHLKKNCLFPRFLSGNLVRRTDVIMVATEDGNQ
jgi:hypothetical protein